MKKKKEERREKRVACARNFTFVLTGSEGKKREGKKMDDIGCGLYKT